jgi:hypothetical protein
LSANKTAEYKIVVGGYVCSNCRLRTETKTAHYCPCCALPMDNFDNERDPNWPGNHYPGVDEFGGSDF